MSFVGGHFVALTETAVCCSMGYVSPSVDTVESPVDCGFGPLVAGAGTRSAAILSRR